MIKKPSDHIKTKFDKIGVLLINLGTPENTDYWSMRKYLKQFLSDRRVIDVFKPLWWIILNGPILAFRPQKSGEAYKRIWDSKKGSPLRYITESQLKKVKTQFKFNKSIIFDYSMRYGKPSISEKLEYLFQKGCSKLLILPLYPQYSASTTASVQDQVFKWLLRKDGNHQSEQFHLGLMITIILKILQKQLKQSFKEKGLPQHLIVSFHGVPRRHLLLGDPYHCHCQKTGD